MAIYPLLLSIIMIIISSAPQSFSQSNSPQNIQTFYPFSPPPPILLPPPPPATDRPSTSSPPPPSSSTRAAVGRAIAATAASTVALSGLVFFLLLWRSRRKRERGIANAAPETTNDANAPTPRIDEFTRFNGNIKGLIVDENGLDVLYWRNLQEEGENKTGFKRENYCKDEKQDEQVKRMVSGRERKCKKPPITEIPLLRGKSSTSQSPVWAENEDNNQIIQKEPSFSNKMSFKAVERQNSSSTQLPPLPLPPRMAAKTPDPPPPPQMAVGAVPRAAQPPPVPSNNGPTPPPPPGPSTKGPTPPPPPSSMKPPAANKRSSSAGEGASASNGKGEVKLKGLHWDKVNPNAVEHSMVWDKIDKGSFKFDGDLMEALFGYVATNRKSPQRDGRSSSPKTDKSGPPSQIFILDTRKSQNIAIVLKSLGITRKEIIDALVEGRGLNADTIEKLAKIAPSDEEASRIVAFKGDLTRLADAESFLYHLLKAVPSAFTRFNAMLFRSNYDLEVSSIKESLRLLEQACAELRTRGLFLKLLEAVLKAGNRLNAGTSRGNAQAFNLTALRKLSDVKSSDRKTTLLQFVVQEVVRAEGKRCVLNRNRSLTRTTSQSSNTESQSPDQSKDDREREYMMLGLPLIGGLSAEFSNVKKAANLDYDHLVAKISAISTQLAETRELVSTCGDNNGKFARETNGFLDTAELEINVLKEEQIRVMEIVKRTRDYYQAGSSREKGTDNSELQLFVIVKDFLGMVDQVCVDIARDVQKRKPASYVSGSSSSLSSPESPRVFRFPKLPANFMSDNSKSSSSGSGGDESEVR